MRASIIITGTEFATGEKKDSNSVFFAKECFEKGIDVSSIHIFKDDEKQISNGINFALRESDIVIVSGGLGPTFDDVTRQAVSIATGEKLIFDQDWLNFLKNDYQKRNVEPTPKRLEMAMRLENSYSILNKNGKALGFIYEKESKKIIVLPGIPQEAKTMLSEALSKIGYSAIIRKINLFRTFGLKESEVSNLLANFRGAFLNVSPMGVDVFLQDNSKVDEIKILLGDYVYETKPIELEEVVSNLLKEKKLTIATAESSTGGLIVSRLINMPGSSDYCLGGIISYSNVSKINILGVEKKTIEQHGAVSEQTAIEMLKGAKKLFNANIILCDTGIAGPSGQTPDKPLGLHYIGIMMHNDIKVYKEIFQAERNYIRLFISQYALNLVRLALKDSTSN